MANKRNDQATKPENAEKPENKEFEVEEITSDLEGVAGGLTSSGTFVNDEGCGGCDGCSHSGCSQCG